MKTAKLGDYLLWKGTLARVISESHTHSIEIEILSPNLCPHCNKELGPKVINVIPTAPLFQENAQPVQTIS